MKFDIKEEHLIIKPYKSQTSVYVREQKGFYQKIRRYLNWLLMFIFIALPFVQFNEQQAVLLDVVKQEFRIFNLTFWPQDFILLAGIFMVAAFALFFVTTWLGRVWCGYVCPQTVWTLAYVWVEHRIEGTRNKRMALDKAPWNLNKVYRKTLKHIIWQLMSLFTATTFISYFIPVNELYSTMLTFDWSGAVTFWVLFFALATYGNAGWMREHVCIHLCPYSRFQSAMFDKNTLLVAYDAKRGENRAPRKRKDDAKALGLGDCVDCNLCVDVCPAGIDIRNGIQYECINCGLCIDACDQTMERFNYPKGLISYTSEQQLAGKKSSRFNLKLASYAGLTLMFILLLGIWIDSRIPLEANIIRDRTALFRVNYEGIVENTYTLKILNKTQQPLHFDIKVKNLSDTKSKLPKNVRIAAGVMEEIPVTIALDGYELEKKITNFDFIIQAVEQPNILVQKKTVFFRN
ncbi:cytochrome c oxidase accessory protein CcoG [Colwellia psychrerythraea]|uniref:Cytochrome c oxidase accessory protein CcoG n=1 Tax=Colwellia psychrerythraea TaxID=28229 RepID=A0A099KR71_COLPS|nr:cytochrome c oxidase accessory protein CcoG [Colwellia psychrerythraea]KGJ92700.1 cytochrome c oxidase accessory protein CcoG [Colwellia psychrerythraea]